MDSENAHPAESRPPTVADLVTICRSLNTEGALYMIVGGFAVNQHGFTRTTMEDRVFLEHRPAEKMRKAQELPKQP
jgi:hypothetical protein